MHKDAAESVLRGGALAMKLLARFSPESRLLPCLRHSGNNAKDRSPPTNCFKSKIQRNRPAEIVPYREETGSSY